ncbi:MAG: hypothetical protein WCH01_11675 [Methylococcaceae bacterium]
MPKFTSKTKTQDAAVFASSDGEGVHGESTSPVVAAIAGIQTNTAPASAGAGIYGESRGAGAGVVGVNKVKLDPGPDGPGGPGGLGGFFESEQKEAVIAESKSLTTAAIAGYQNNPNGIGAAIYAEHIGLANGDAGLAAFFKGNVIVTGDISFPGQDLAEHFIIKDDVFTEPGTVMVLSGTGELVPCVNPYEKKVVGVVAGAGSFRPGIVLGKLEKSVSLRQPIALVGKVFCKVDASYGPIEVGDLLTSSATHGHAMKASDPTRAFGSVIGKAMAPLGDGLGLIPILISLQ